MGLGPQGATSQISPYGVPQPGNNQQVCAHRYAAENVPTPCPRHHYARGFAPSSRRHGWAYTVAGHENFRRPHSRRQAHQGAAFAPRGYPYSQDHHILGHHNIGRLSHTNPSPERTTRPKKERNRTLGKTLGSALKIPPLCGLNAVLSARDPDGLWARCIHAN